MNFEQIFTNFGPSSIKMSPVEAWLHFSTRQKRLRMFFHFWIPKTRKKTARGDSLVPRPENRKKRVEITFENENEISILCN